MSEELGGSQSGPGGDEPTDADRALIRRIFGFNPNLIEQEAPQWFANFVSRIEVSNLAIPIGQVVGYTQNVPQVATPIITNDSMTTTTYTDLATTGPTLSALPDGQYLILFGCAGNVANPATNEAYMAVQVNSTAADDNDRVQFNSTANSSGARVIYKTVSGGGSNTLTAKYRVATAGQTGNFNNRWMIAIRMTNA